MIPYVGHDPSENQPHPRQPRGPQGNGPAQQNLTPELRTRLAGIRARHPEWSATTALKVLSYQIGRYPPFTRQALYKQERRSAR